MEQSDDEEPQKSMMEEALQILNEEGFKLPEDVVDTLTTAGRSSATPRRKGSLRGHKMCESQSNTRKVRNVRESGSRRSSSGDRTNNSSSTNAGKEYEVNRTTANTTSPRQPQQYQKAGSDNVFFAADEEKNENSLYLNRNDVDRRGVLEREESSESNSTCSASTVREVPRGDSQTTRGPLQRQDSGSSVGSSASVFSRKPFKIDDRRSSTDTGYNTSIENALQVHEARAENLKNINKHVENISEKINSGLRRDLSKDSGFTETGDAVCYSQTAPQVPGPDVGSTKEFRDVAMSNTDQSERIISSDSGDAHVVTTTSNDMSSAEMSSRNNEITADGTAVSSAAKLTNQDCESALSRTLVKRTKDEVSKQEDFESENRTTKSSKNDSISTSVAGITTAASRHASSMDQDLNKETSKMSTSTDGRSLTSSMSVDQQLARHQEVSNIEQSNDGTSKEENKKISEKALMSKSLSEHQTKSEDGSTVGVLTASQDLQANTKHSQNEESLIGPDGTVAKKRLDSTSSSMSEKSTSEQKTVKQLPYGGAASTELVKKSDNSSVSKSSSSFSEVKETPTGRSEISNSEDSNSMASSFSGQCESTETVNGVKLHRTMSSENSVENKLKSSKSVSSYSNSGYDAVNDNISSRRLSNVSNASTLSNVSGMSRENIKPPSYEETINNLSRQNSRSSTFSRQDSGASSIASSASAFNERQRQKQKMMAENRSLSNDSVTKLKEVENSQYDRKFPEHTRQNSFESDSTLSGGSAGLRSNAYHNVEGKDYFVESPTSDRVITYPIRQVDSVKYSRSVTDSLCDRKPNRRATLHGDVVVTERELREAREDIHSNLRGMDDSYISRRGDNILMQEKAASRKGNGRRRVEGSFEQDVKRMVDKFFDDDDDDDFGFGFSSRKIKAPSFHDTDDLYRNYNTDRPLSSSRSHQNPYSTREDLSLFSLRTDSDKRGVSDYPASESGYPCTSANRYQSDNRYKGRDSGFPDTVSDSGGYKRYGRNRNDWEDNRFSPLESHNSESLLSSQARIKNTNQYSNTSSRYNTSAAGDNLQSAGKSINRDRSINASILGVGGNRRREYEAMRNPIADDRGYSDINDGSVYSGNYADSRCESDFDMSDAGSTCPSLHSLPPNVHRLRGDQASLDDFRTRSLPDIPNANSGGRKQSHVEKDAHWENKRQRIDKALSWIRAELGVLRSQDKVLMTQFQRCQDSIEQLKKQRPWYEVFSDDEEEEEGRHWEDWEIDEFDRSCQSERRDREYGTKSGMEGKSGTVYTKDFQRMSLTTE